MVPDALTYASLSRVAADVSCRTALEVAAADPATCPRDACIPSCRLRFTAVGGPAADSPPNGAGVGEFYHPIQVYHVTPPRCTFQPFSPYHLSRITKVEWVDRPGGYPTAMTALHANQGYRPGGAVALIPFLVCDFVSWMMYRTNPD